MGGAAVNGIIVAGSIGGGVLLSSTAAGVMDGTVEDEEDKEKLMEMFRKVCRRAEWFEATSSSSSGTGT